MNNTIYDALLEIYADSDAAVVVLDDSLTPLWANATAERLRPSFFRAGAFDVPERDDLLERLAKYGTAYYRFSAFPASSDGIILIRHDDLVVAMADVATGLPAQQDTSNADGIDVFTNIMRSGIDNITLSSQSIERMIDIENQDADYMFGNIRRSSYKLLRNIQNATLLSKYLAGTLVSNPESCNLNELCATLCLAARSICKHPVKVHFTAPGEDIISSVDVRLAERAILNVLLNAMYFTRPGNEIEVSLSQAAGQIMLTIKDKGAGIDPHNLPYVKEPYFSFDPENPDGSRLGLGLSVAAIFCHQHGGTLLIDSEHGEGTSVAMSFKKKPDEDNQYFMANIADYVTDTFSPVYVELCDVCEIPS